MATPQIGEKEKTRIHQLSDEIEAAVESRPEFDRFSQRELEITARLMVSYGITSIEELKDLDLTIPVCEQNVNLYSL